MFVDARLASEGQLFEADVCVIGAGAAGIPLALALEAGGLDVCLLESGGFEPDAATQGLYEGRVIDGDYAPLTAARLRYLGGTTNHWGGACQPLDAFEFEAHPWVEESGWPIERAELDPFYEEARPILGLPHPHYRFEGSEVSAEGQAQLLGAEDPGFEPVVWRRTRPGPTRLGVKYRSQLENSQRIRCLHHANVSELVVDDARTSVRRAEVRALNGRKLAVRSRVFVLCAGAIESARILLLSDRQVEGGLGNGNDLVGRYFADHGSRILGEIRILAPGQEFQEESFLLHPPGPFVGDVAGFRSSPELRKRHQLLGFAVLFFPLPDAAGIATSASERGIAELTAGPEASPRGEATRESRPRGMRVHSAEEKSPNPASRVFLQRETDALGLRKVAVDLNTRARDWKSSHRSALLLGAAVARAGHGRLRLFETDPNSWATLPGHQLGTTRMSDDPKRGVTDREGRVHGMTNLYVSGGSLFPTHGWQNPTLTIVALALRLARRLTDGSAKMRALD